MCGVSDVQIQRRLLVERTLTFTKALEIAQGLEYWPSEVLAAVYRLEGTQRHALKSL